MCLETHIENPADLKLKNCAKLLSKLCRLTYHEDMGISSNFDHDIFASHVIYNPIWFFHPPRELSNGTYQATSNFRLILLTQDKSDNV